MVNLLTKTSPFYRRLNAYLKERFPLFGYGILIVSYYSSNQFLAQSLLASGTQMHYTARSLLGACVLLCLFFHLRVFDEHKDYADDCLYYPERVLQRGLITLDDLKILGGLALGLEIVIASLLGFPVLVSVLAALIFSVFMLKEFFIRNWLRRHFLVYATSHMLIMPLLAVVVFSITTNKYFWQAPGWFWLYSFVGFFVSFNWEISRKIRAPEQEREGVDTYTKILGTYGAGYTVLLIRIIDTAMVAYVGYRLHLSHWFYLGLSALYLVCLFGFLQYRFQTNAQTAKRMEIYAGMYIVAFDIILAVELARKFGLKFF